MELMELERLLPEIEQREKAEQADRKSREDKLRLLWRACFQGLIPRPVRGKHWWSGQVCPKCRSGFRARFVVIDDRRRLHWTCESESCGYEYVS